MGRTLSAYQECYFGSTVHTHICGENQDIVEVGKYKELHESIGKQFGMMWQQQCAVNQVKVHVYDCIFVHKFWGKPDEGYLKAFMT